MSAPTTPCVFVSSVGVSLLLGWDQTSLIGFHWLVDRVYFRSFTDPSCLLDMDKDGMSRIQAKLHLLEQTEAFFGSVPTI